MKIVFYMQVEGRLRMRKSGYRFSWSMASSKCLCLIRRGGATCAFAVQSMHFGEMIPSSRWSVRPEVGDCTHEREQLTCSWEFCQGSDIINKKPPLHLANRGAWRDKVVSEQLPWRNDRISWFAC
jgi:hypothetical protein